MSANVKSFLSILIDKTYRARSTPRKCNQLGAKKVFMDNYDRSKK